MENIKAVIFDIDGTLADSLDVWAEADRIFLARRGYEYDSSVSAAMKTMHFMSAAEYLRQLYHIPDSLESVASEITDIVREKYFFEVKLMPYAKELIEALKKRGIKMCAATSNSRELAEGVLRHNGILDSLEFIITSDEAGSSKDDPKIFYMCAEKMGTSPAETAVIEDSPHAAKTAFDSGFYTIGTNSGHFGDFEALKGCVHRRIESFKELI